MVEGKWLPPGADIEPALFLRQEIFCAGRDEKDDYAWQALAFFEGKAVATGRIWWEDGAFFIGTIGVLPSYRGLRFGDFITRLLLFKAQQHNAVKVRLHAGSQAAPFFMRYGFRPAPNQQGSDPLLFELDGQDILLGSCESSKG